MYIKLKPTKDTIITELKPTNNYGRDSELFVGSSLLYNEDDQLVSYFKKKSRILISFDIEQYKNILKQLGDNYTAKLVLFDKTNYIEQKNKEPFRLNIYPLAVDWDEGIYYASEGKHQQSSWNEKDYQRNSWFFDINSFTSTLTSWNSYYESYSGSMTATVGGSYFEAIPLEGDIIKSSSASLLTYGTEHSVFDVKGIVDCWVNDEIPNYGFLIKLDDLYEESVRHNSLTGQEFMKHYYSRHTHKIFRPYLEIYYEDAICNDRNIFYRGLNQTLYKSMIIYDDIVDLNGTGNFPGTVDIYERVATTAGTSAVLYKSGLEATRRSTGYYYTTFSYTGSATSIIDVWNFDINQVSNTATLSAYMDYINMEFANGLSGTSTIVSQYDNSAIKRIEIQNINDYYLNEDIIRLEFYFYKNNSIIPTFTYMSNSIPNSAKATIKNAYVSFVELSTGLVVVPPIKLNYNDSHSWIELSSTIFYKNKTYYPILYYNDLKKTFNDYTFTVR